MSKYGRNINNTRAPRLYYTVDNYYNLAAAVHH